MPEMLDELNIARNSGELKKLLSAHKKVDLLILDEWLIRPLLLQEAYDLLEIVETRCQRSMIFCTQALSFPSAKRIICLKHKLPNWRIPLSVMLVHWNAAKDPSPPLIWFPVSALSLKFLLKI